MPAWLIALQLALALEPKLVEAIELAKLPARTEEEMQVLMTSMDQAVKKLQEAIG
jgi:hypothetical protein